MKKVFLLVLGMMIVFSAAWAQDQEQTQEQPKEEPQAVPADVPQDSPQDTPKEPPKNVPKDFKMGRVFFPKAFIHEGKDFPSGTYHVVLTDKESVPFFNVYNKKGDLLFSELAIVVPKDTKSKRGGISVKKQIMKDSEYFRIKIIKPNDLVMAYFLLKTIPTPEAEPKDTPTPEQPQDQPAEPENTETSTAE